MYLPLISLLSFGFATFSWGYANFYFWLRPSELESEKKASGSRQSTIFEVPLFCVRGLSRLYFKTGFFVVFAFRSSRLHESNVFSSFAASTPGDPSPLAGAKTHEV